MQTKDFAKTTGSHSSHKGIRGTSLPVKVLGKWLDRQKYAIQCAEKPIVAHHFGEDLRLSVN